MYSRRAGTQSQESVFSLSIVRLVDWPQAPTSDLGLATLPGQRWRSLSVVCGEVMLIQRTPRASGKPQAMSHTGPTEQCCGKTLWLQKHQSCGQQKSRSCMVFFCLQTESSISYHQNGVSLGWLNWFTFDTRHLFQFYFSLRVVFFNRGHCHGVSNTMHKHTNAPGCTEYAIC